MKAFRCVAAYGQNIVRTGKNGDLADSELAIHRFNDVQDGKQRVTVGRDFRDFLAVLVSDATDYHGSTPK